MPSYNYPSPPHSTFSKPIPPPHFSRRSPSVYSNDSIPSHFSEKMIPPQYAPNVHPTSQFSTPPSPTTQNAILSQPWLWLPQHKCRLINDENLQNIYLIKLVTWDGYEKRFDLQLLTPSSSRTSQAEILHDIPEDVLLAIRQHPSSLPRPSLPHGHRPRAPIRRVSSVRVGMHGQAMGIAVNETMQTPFTHQHHTFGSFPSSPSVSEHSGNEFMYSPYNDAMNSPQQQYFGNGGQRERYTRTSSPNSRDSRQSGSRVPRSGRDGAVRERRGGGYDSGSSSSGFSRESRRSGSGGSGSGRRERGGEGYSSASSASYRDSRVEGREKRRSGSDGGRNDRDSRTKEKKSGSRHRSSDSDSDRGSASGRGGNERRGDSRKSSPKGTKEKDKKKSGGKEKKSFSRSRSRSPQSARSSTASLFGVKMRK